MWAGAIAGVFAWRERKMAENERAWPH